MNRIEIFVNTRDEIAALSVSDELVVACTWFVVFAGAAAGAAVGAAAAYLTHQAGGYHSEDDIDLPGTRITGMSVGDLLHVREDAIAA